MICKVCGRDDAVAWIVSFGGDFCASCWRATPVAVEEPKPVVEPKPAHRERAGAAAGQMFGFKEIP